MYDENPEVVWHPKEGSSGSLKRFEENIQNKYNTKFNDYWDLHKWSVENRPEFWAEMWDFYGIICSKKYDKVIDPDAKCDDIPVWFEGARLNYAENVLKYRDDHVALIVVGEDRPPKRVTSAQLYEEACLYGAALKKIGVKKGDCVACYISNREEPVYAMLGSTSLGALWTTALPLLGPKAALSRFTLTKPKVLFTIDRFRHNGTEVEMLEKIRELANELPSLEKVVIVASTPESTRKDISGIKNSCFLEEFLELGRRENGSVPELEFEQLPTNHPVFISYTSGTTGSPKALIHGSGCLFGNSTDFLMYLSCDRDSVVLSASPPGWVTWNMFSTMLASGATLVNYEGVPFYLSPTYLWDLVDELEITNLFLPPAILDELERRKCVPSPKNHLKSLKLIDCSGSVVKDQNYDFIYKKIKSSIKFGTCYASTELMGQGLTCVPTLPVHKGEINAPTLGCDVRCFSSSGESVIGEVGELVILTPIPSLPLGLWSDEGGKLYKEVYCGKFAGAFSPGDLCLINPVTRGYIIHGRSDDIMNPKGTRFGCVEIYNVVNILEGVLDSLCVAQYNKSREERAVLFVKMKEGYLFTEELVQRIRTAITKQLTAKHIPEIIVETKGIPMNMTGKKLEILVKKIINGMPYNAETVMNPQCLGCYKNVPELQGYF